MTDEATETPIEEGRLVPCSGTQMGLLWQAHSLKGCDDHQSDKAEIARKFKRRMTVAKSYQPKQGGGFIEENNPRGDRHFAEGTHMLPLTKAEAVNFQKLLDELKKKNNVDGTPVIDASVADEIEDLEERAFPMWKATVPDGNGSAPAIESPDVPLLESKKPATTAEEESDA